MTNDLHDRLEYLVNYSSQLIFVSGDSIAQQQRTLEAFVFQQPDETEIAYITADTTMSVSDYRRQLCRQLLGQVVGSYVRPLNELLASLNHYEGPVLIAVTQAQNMPDKLLQELWDLVLQSRFAGNKLHLNVLLFAETTWAERAKKWLPAKNTDMPLLISSHSVNPPPTQESQLDQLISKRRQAFHQHLLNRQKALPTTRVLRSPWFIGFTVLCFLAVFSSLVIWQHADTISSLFSPIEPTTPQQSAEAPVPGSAIDESFISVNEQSNASPLTAASPEDEVTSVALVSQWPFEPEPQPEPSSQVEAQPANPMPDLSDSNSLTTPAPPPVASEADELIRWLSDTDIKASARYVQLSGLSDEKLMREFIADNNLSDITRSYRTYRYGGNWFVVVLAEPFNSAQEAKSAIQSLPFYPSREQAFIKSGQQILDEISASKP